MYLSGHKYTFLPNGAGIKLLSPLLLFWRWLEEVEKGLDAVGVRARGPAVRVLGARLRDWRPFRAVRKRMLLRFIVRIRGEL